MNWNKLKENKCPKCGKDLVFEDDPDYFYCTCGFKISTMKFKRLISERMGAALVEPHYRPDDEVPEE